MEGRVPVPVLRAQAGSGLDQKVDTLRPPVGRSAAQSRPEVNILSLQEERSLNTQQSELLVN